MTERSESSAQTNGDGGARTSNGGARTGDGGARTGDGGTRAGDGGRHGPRGSRRSFLAGIGAVGIGAALAGCPTAGDDAGPTGFVRVPPEDDRTRWGEPLTIGEGEVRTFVTVDPDTGDKMVGAEFTPGLLNPEPLPTEHTLYSVPIPDSDEVPFTWLGLDWEPGGHYPGDKYAIPHYDFHFYFPPESTIAQIPEIGLPPEESEKLYTYPLAEDMIPPNYFRTNYTFPYMGEHLYNESDPQYNGGTFGNTFVYGHWDGDLIFMEPMITLPYFEQLKAGSEDSELGQLEGVDQVDHRELYSPERFPEAGEYPTEYTVQYHEDRDVFTVTEHTFDHFEKTRGMVESTETTGGTDADATVAVGPGGELVFEPETLEVAPGDTVTFEWKSDYHNVVPTDVPAGSSWKGEPDISEQGHTHTYTFEVEGEYKYICEPHVGVGMKGSVVVGDV